MTYVIAEPCIDVLDLSCVSVCPVDCIHYDEGTDRKLFIDPNECIDCGACEPECPTTAIFEESALPEKWKAFIEVNAVFSGHEHIYERVRPEDSIYYFILGNSGKLMTHDFRSSEGMEKGFDTDLSFMLVEIANDELHFQTISRRGDTIDSGAVNRLVQSNSASRDR